jgi:hypothetical protein
MSLSEPTRVKNPAQKFIEWSGDKNAFFYFDKEKEKAEKGTGKCYFESDIYIIVLDQLSTITGFSDKLQNGIWSNEVKYLDKQPLIVKSKPGVLISGLYSKIKAEIITAGGKFTTSAYAAMLIPQGKGVVPKLELVNFKLHGSSIGAWIDAKIQEDGCVLTLKKGTEQKTKGRTVYYEPVIIKNAKRDDLILLAENMDKELQIYLKMYFSNDFQNSAVQEVKSEIENTNALLSSSSPVVDLSDVDDLPF